MKMIKEDLVRVISKVLRALPKVGYKPILLNVLFRSAGKGKATVTGLDLGDCVTCEMEGEWKKPALVDGRRLLKAVKAAPKGAEVYLSSDGEKFLVAHRSSFALVSPPVDDYPVPPECSRTYGRVKDASLLVAGLRRVQWCISGESMRYAVNNAMMKMDGGEITLEATDGRRLGRATVPLTRKSKILALLPVSTVAHAINLFAKSADPIEVRGEGDKSRPGYIELVSGGASLVCRTAEGTWPDFDGGPLKWGELVTKWRVPRAEIKAAYAALLPVAEAGSGLRAVFHLTKNRRSVTAKTENGEAEYVFENDSISGAAQDVPLNPEDWALAMRHFDGDSVQLLFPDTNVVVIKEPAYLFGATKCGG